MRLRHVTAVLAVALSTVAAPQAALAADYHAAIRDCNDDGVLQGRYSQHTLRQARNHLPSSLREYSDCEDVLARALAAAAKPGSGGTGGGNPTPPPRGPPPPTRRGAHAPNPGGETALRGP